MANIRFQSAQAAPALYGPALAALVASAKPYLTALLIVTILMSIWIGLRAG